MTKWLSKNIVLALGLSISVAGSFAPSTSLAASRSCRDFFKNQERASDVTADTALRGRLPDDILFTSNPIYKSIKLSSQEITTLNAKLKANGFRKTDKTLIVDIVAEMVDQLESLRIADQEKADRIGEVAYAMYKPIYDNRPYPADLRMDLTAPREARSIMSVFLEAIYHYERFKISDYKSSSTLAMARTDSPVHFITLEGLAPWVKSYVDNIPKEDPAGIYNNLPNTGQGILGFGDIRDTASYNRWVLEMKGHDMKHGHFLFGHPWAGNAYFRSARSKNALRYTMMGGLFELVDTVQYGWEGKLTTYFDVTRKMKAEDSMIYMGVLPMRALKELQSELSIGNMGGALDIFSAWKPKKSGEFQPEGSSGKGLDFDLMQMMAANYRLLQDPAMNKFTNFSMHAAQVQQGGVDVDDKRPNHW